jgi:2-octaprenylphenol hydroxylase
LSKEFQVVIVGAGMTGLTVAALLARSRHNDKLRLTVIDAAARPCYLNEEDTALRVSAIATGSAELLQAIGAWAQIRDTRASAYEHMRVWDETGSADSASALRFDAAEFAVAQLGFIVENSLVQAAILEVLDAADVDLVFDAPISALRQAGHGYQLELDGGDTLHADLVIGADGARSFVRERVGIATRDYPYGQSAFVTHAAPEESHDKTAWQRFLRDGPIGMLPLSDGRISIVWSTQDATADGAMNAADDRLGAMLSAASDHVLGELTVAGPRGKFPLCARHAEQYVVPGVALIGDAAHAVHPLAGQGANLGLQDAAMLADVIVKALDKGEHPGDRPVLRRYERARKGDNATMLHLMTGLNRLFATDSALVRELRAAGMRLFNVSGPIREHAVKVALGGVRQSDIVRLAAARGQVNR